MKAKVKDKDSCKVSKHRIEFICPECGHIEQKLTRHIIYDAMITVFVAIGFAALILIAILGPTVFSNYADSGLLTVYARMHSDDFREYALNITTYDGFDSFLFAKNLAENLPEIRYVPTNKFNLLLQDPEDTIRFGGDCKDDSILFSSLMMAAGYKSRADCSLDDRHCVARIEYEGHREFVNNAEVVNEYMIVDLTGSYMRIYNSSVDHWQDPEDYIVMMFY